MINNARAMMVFEARKKSTGLAYVMWFFLGVVSAHRFYAGQILLPVLQILTVLCFGIGLIWVLIDIFLIPNIIRNYNLSLITDLERAQ